MRPQSSRRCGRACRTPRCARICGNAATRVPGNSAGSVPRPRPLTSTRQPSERSDGGPTLCPVNILHLYKDYYPVVGGIENHLRGLAHAQAARGHRVPVLLTSPTQHTRVEQRGGVRIIFAGRLTTVASTPLSLALPLRL